jgi:hypothetical protein
MLYFLGLWYGSFDLGFRIGKRWTEGYAILDDDDGLIADIGCPVSSSEHINIKKKQLVILINNHWSN